MLSGQTKSLSENLQALSPVGVIESLAKWATQNNLPFAVYRLPQKNSFDFIIGSAITKVSDQDLSGLTSGFLISSYNGEKYFINQAVSYSSEENELKLYTSLPDYITLETISEQNKNWQPYSVVNPTRETPKQEYLDHVTTCVEEIKATDLIKVVPSRVKRVDLPPEHDLGDTFIRLCESYNNAFISLLSTPELGTWIGATPESLIEVDNQGIFKTMSLAGTQRYENEQPLHTLPWTEKEIEEQAMVSRYIINRFKEIRLREFEEVGPRTMKAGNLAHLCSTFTVDTIATSYPDLGSVMLKLLHPTSAVCGMPKTNAQALLKVLEKHPRKLYSGYFGPVNMPEGSHIYVNLRCMEVLNGEAILYAGAGVTAYSVPDDEWDETELKCKTLLNIIYV
jgi:isochorismate synthase